jgi:hypothetical protein
MRYELTEYEWAAVKPFLPNKPRGVPPQINSERFRQSNLKAYSPAIPRVWLIQWRMNRPLPGRDCIVGYFVGYYGI